MMELKVGDKVLIRKDLKVEQLDTLNGIISIDEEMTNNKGRIKTITYIILIGDGKEKFYELDNDDRHFYTKDMFEDVNILNGLEMFTKIYNGEVERKDKIEYHNGTNKILKMKVCYFPKYHQYVLRNIDDKNLFNQEVYMSYLTGDNGWFVLENKVYVDFSKAYEEYLKGNEIKSIISKKVYRKGDISFTLDKKEIDGDWLVLK